MRSRRGASWGLYLFNLAVPVVPSMIAARIQGDFRSQVVVSADRGRGEVHFALKDAAKRLVEESDSGVPDRWGYVSISMPEKIAYRGQLR